MTSSCSRWQQKPNQLAVRFSQTFRNSPSVDVHRRADVRLTKSWLTNHIKPKRGVPFCFFSSQSMASPALFQGAIFAASIKVVYKYLLRCFDSGLRCAVLPELFSAPHSPQ